MNSLVMRREFLLLASGSVLVGCGFQPVYMSTASGQSGPAQRELSAIEVNRIGDRPGQILRQELQERLQSDASGGLHRYNLIVVFAVSGEGIGILSDTSATRVRLTATANWRLTAQDQSGTQLISGVARAIDGFDILDQQYFAADLDTERVQRRLAASVADEIALQLAVYFRRRAAIASR